MGSHGHDHGWRGGGGRGRGRVPGRGRGQRCDHSHGRGRGHCPRDAMDMGVSVGVTDTTHGCAFPMHGSRGKAMGNGYVII